MNETLKILIEGDASGLQTQLNKGMSLIQTFVSQANSQQLNWQNILAGALDTAIITGIASTFAEAIESSIQFQSTQAATAAQAGESAATVGTIGTAALATSNQTGQAASDIQSSIAAFLPIVGSMSAATEAANQSAELAAIGMGSIGDVTQSLIPIFQQWGVTSSAQIDAVVNDIFNAAAAIGPGQFLNVAQSLQTFGVGFIEAGANVSDLQNILATFGAQSAVSGIAATTKDFQTLGSAAGGLSQDGIALASMAGGAAKLKEQIVDGQVPQAMEALSNAVKNMPAFEAQGFGIDPQTLLGLQQFATNFPKISQAVAAIETVDWRTVDQAFNDMDSASVDLAKVWQTLKNLLTDPAIGAVIDTIAKDMLIFIEAVATFVTTEGPLLKSLFESIGGLVATLATDAVTFVTTLTGTSISSTLTGMVADFNQIVGIIKLLVDGLSVFGAEAGAVGTVIGNIFSGNFSANAKVISDLMSSPTLTQFSKDWTAFSTGQYLPTGTTAQGAAAGGAVILGGAALATGGAISEAATLSAANNLGYANSYGYQGGTNPSKPLAELNNNPGDLNYAGQAGATPSAPEGTEGNTFAVFQSFQAGFQALMNDLQAKIDRNGTETIAALSKIYTTTNQAGWASTVASQLGVSINTPISQLAGELQQFARAVSVAEDSNNPNLASIPKTTNTTNNVALNFNVNGTQGAGTASMYQQYVGATAMLKTPVV